MATLASILHDVLHEGRIHVQAAPADADDPGTLAVLRQAYDAYCLSVAGPMLPFDGAAALAAGRLLAWAAWYSLNPDVPIETPEKVLCMPMWPTKAEQHLSADVILRFVPTLHRRAKVLMQNDVLPLTLEKTLREWPLSGVFADIVDSPLTPVDFGAHAGLNFLYAERLAKHERVGWFPLGCGMQYVELVWSQLGKDVSMLPAQAEEMVAGAEPEA